MSKSNPYVSSVAALAVLGSAIFAASQNFVPDFVFKGSVLTGWHKLGAADWHAENGEIIGAAKPRRRLAGARQGLSGHRILHLVPLHGRLQERECCCARKRCQTA